MAIERIQAMLEACVTGSGSFPPTVLYNESWLLRLALDWFCAHRVPGHPLDFLDGARWFSEAALPSRFLRNAGGAKLAEGWSHADGVIGHFEVGKGHRIDLSLLSEAVQLVVLEAKMFSRLASRTTNVSYYDQASRSVACIAETLARANRDPSKLTSLSFCVLAPASQIEQGVFAQEMSKDSVGSKVELRVKEYVDHGDQSKRDWYDKWFLPTLRRMILPVMSWEQIIEDIERDDAESGVAFRHFYTQCLLCGSQTASLPVDHP